MNTAGLVLRAVAAGLLVLLPLACVDLTPPWEKVSSLDAAASGAPETGGSIATGGATDGSLGGATDPGPSDAGGTSGDFHGGSYGKGEEPDASPMDLPIPAVDGPVLADLPVPTSSPDAGGTTAGESTSRAGGSIGTGGAGKSGGASGSGGRSGGGTSGSRTSKATSSAVKPDAGADAHPDAGPLASGLLLYYTFESVSGAVIPDQSGNGNDGTLRSDATDPGVPNDSHQLGAGKVGQGLKLIRNGNGHIAMPPVPFRGLTEMTIATWVKIVTATNWQRLFDIGVDGHSSINPRTGSKYMNLAAETETANMAFGISKDGLSNERAISTTSPSVDVWTHVAVVLASDGSGKLYVDGALAASNASLGLHPRDLGTIDYAYIGKSPFSKDPYLDAVIDEFRVYGRALSPAEVLALRQLTGP